MTEPDWSKWKQKSRVAKRAAQSVGNTLTNRDLSQRVKTARGRKISSTIWLQRQLNDPYVSEAKRLGYRSRAAFKLLQANEKYNFLHANARVVDLGAAPGGWTQVAIQKVGKAGQVVGIDLLEVEAIPGATLVQGDFLQQGAAENLKTLLGGPATVVMSDMAASATGHAPTDHLRIMALCDAALEFAMDVLKPDGSYIAKVLKGGAEASLLKKLKENFKSVRHFKPAASRSDSAEAYVIALGFKKDV